MEERLYSVSLSQRAAQDAQIRLAKIIGQLKSVSKMLEESPRDLDALTQYAAANAAVGSLMKLIAKDVILTQLGNEVRNDAVCSVNDILYDKGLLENNHLELPLCLAGRYPR